MERTFASDKAAKLKRLPLLRVMNALGMVAWRESVYNDAEQETRLLHPLTWILIVVAFFVGVFMQGVPATVEDLAASLKDDTVWF
jgi:hypothetical protein